jgi:hypothetical protein
VSKHRSIVGAPVNFDERLQRLQDQPDYEHERPVDERSGIRRPQRLTDPVEIRYALLNRRHPTS